MTLNYTIQLLSEWHIGSGLSGGVAADAIVLKDHDGLPYLPGKTIKGLLRDALMEIHEVQSNKSTLEDIQILLGEENNTQDTSDGNEAICQNDFGTNAHFSNAILSEQERNEIIENNLAPYLYRNLSSTKINNKGLAEDKSLRAMEVCVPVILNGSIHGISQEQQKLLEMAMRWTRRLGLKRNRGLGKCVFNFKNESL